jgi:hypothetical protein
MASIDPPKLCPACGRDVDDRAAPCGACGYRQTLSAWERAELPRLRRAAMVDGATSLALSMMVGVGAGLFALVLGASAHPFAWLGLLLGAAFGAVALLLAAVGVDRLRAIGLPVLWTYALDDVSVSSFVDNPALGLRLEGARDERMLLSLNPQWREVAASDEALRAMLRWIDARYALSETDVDTALGRYLLREARCTLAVARLSSVGAVQLVALRATRWRRGPTRAAAAPPSSEIDTLIARGHGVLPEDAGWALERAMLAALDRLLGDGASAVSPTPEMMHYREAQLRAGALRSVSVQALLLALVGMDGQEGWLALDALVAQSRALDAPPSSSLAELEADRAVMANVISSLFELFVDPDAEGW